MSNFVIAPDTDWEQAVNMLADARMVMDRAEGLDGTRREDYLQFAVKRLDPALRAARLGHTVEWDSTGQDAGRGSARKWTCLVCYQGIYVQGTRIYQVTGRRSHPLAPCRGQGPG
jgi:hypothetical protein